MQGIAGATFYTNKESRVHVHDYSFRNPPTLINYEHPTELQAATETDVVLEHLVTHASTAPFFCKKLIQRLTSSNPSPRYVKEVATAFRSGEYNGRVYSGAYGDLGAAVAAIFLDREARDATLDVDPAAGKLREPLLKVIHLLRSLDFEPRNGMEIELGKMDLKIGQYAYSAPSIFNFYLPDHTPAGPAAKASLHAPEAEIMSTPFVIAYMNGVASLVDNGLTACEGGFAWGSLPSYNPHLFTPQNCGNRDTMRQTNEGDLMYIAERGQSLLHDANNDILSELSLLLTGGIVPHAISSYYAAAQRSQPEVAFGEGPRNVVDESGCIGNATDWVGTLAEATERCSQDPDCGWLHEIHYRALIVSYSLARSNWKLGRDQWAGDTNSGITSIDDCSSRADSWQVANPSMAAYFSYNPANNWCQWGPHAAFETGTSHDTYSSHVLNATLTATWRACGPTAGMIEAPTAADPLAGSRSMIRRVPDISAVLPTLIKLFAYSAEFHATNLNVLQSSPRAMLPEIPTQHRPYKAIIVLFFEGGADSFSMLIPLCTDMYEEYAAVRGNVALNVAQILPMAEIDADYNNTQPCTTFGTHPVLGVVQSLWDAGEASWFANIGSLIEPLTLEEWNTNRKENRKARKPPSLFGHDTQQRQCQSVHSDNTGAKGILGRVMEAMTTQDLPYRSNVYSMYGIRKLMEGNVPSTVMSLAGIQRFAQFDDLAQGLRDITGVESRSIFADTYASILEKSLEETERLGRQMLNVTLIGDYGSTGLENVARTIALRPHLSPAVNSERDVFMVGRRTFDSHSNAYSMNAGHLGAFNQDLQALRDDMVALGMWESITVLTISDFARTLSSNGHGTDHAWGGNMFMLGGSVRGRRIHGQFPDDLNPATSQLEVGRGRGVLIPTTPWEGMWWGVAQWFGVEDDQLLEVLPNAVNFEEGSTLLTREQLFID